MNRLVQSLLTPLGACVLQLPGWLFSVRESAVEFGRPYALSGSESSAFSRSK